MAGETIEVVCDGQLLHLRHRGVLIATHARRHKIADQAKRSHGASSARSVAPAHHGSRRRLRR